MNVEELTRCVDGKPAPMPLLAVEAFANTLDVEDEIDQLADRDQFADWLERTGLAEGKIKLGDKAMDEARSFRAVIRDLLAANERGERDEAASRALASLAADHRVQLAADPETGELAPDLSPADSVHDLVCLLLGIVAQAQTTGTWDRLKLCENPDCLWAFYDSSKNRSGSWCRTGLCGNRIKNRAYRERQRAG